MRIAEAYQQLPYIKYLQRDSSTYIFNSQTLVARYAGHVVMNGLKTVSEFLVLVPIIFFLAYINFLVFISMACLLGITVFAYDRILGKQLNIFGQKANASQRKMIEGITHPFQKMNTVEHPNYWYLT